MYYFKITNLLSGETFKSIKPYSSPSNAQISAFKLVKLSGLKSVTISIYHR